MRRKLIAYAHTDHMRLHSRQRFQNAMAMLSDANVLGRTHAEALSGASREIKACAHAIRNSPRSPVIDSDNNRTAILGICHG